MDRKRHPSFLQRTAQQAEADRLRRDDPMHKKGQDFLDEHMLLKGQHDKGLTLEQAIEQYLTLKQAAILDDQNVWVVRNFDGETGVIFDYFSKSERVAFVDFDFSSGAKCDVFIGCSVSDLSQGLEPIFARSYTGSSGYINLGRAIQWVEDNTERITL